MNLLEVTGLKKVYTQRLGAKPNVALRNVSFSAAKGEYRYYGRKRLRQDYPAQHTRNA